MLFSTSLCSSLSKPSLPGVANFEWVCPTFETMLVGAYLGYLRPFDQSGLTKTFNNYCPASTGVPCKPGGSIVLVIARLNVI